MEQVEQHPHFEPLAECDATGYDFLPRAYTRGESEPEAQKGEPRGARLSSFLHSSHVYAVGHLLDADTGGPGSDAIGPVGR